MRATPRDGFHGALYQEAMNDSGLSIWTNTRFSEPAATLLREGTSSHQLVVAGDLGASEADEALRKSDIVFGQPGVEVLMGSTGLKWVHVSSAGYTNFDRDDFREFLQTRSAFMSNSSNVFDEPCAQHVLAMMLADARQLLPSFESQRSDQAWQSGERRAGSYLLNGQSVLILGFGAIARRLAQLLAPFNMNISALRRHPSGNEGVEIIGEGDVERALGEADHVVNILPESDSTRGWMNEVRFSQMKRGARFYNIGRGATVDQNALLQALNTSALELAYLDVTSPEPLPPAHPLWSAPNCFLTPHTAGGHKGEEERLVKHFLRNLRAFECGEALVDLVA